MNIFKKHKILSDYDKYRSKIIWKKVYFRIRGIKKRFLGYNDNYDSIYNSRFTRCKLDGFFIIKRFKNYKIYE
jgi:hypothetical protein